MAKKYGVANPDISNKTDSYAFLEWFGDLAKFALSLYKTVTITANYNILADDFYIRANATGGAITITLPKSGNVIGRQIIVTKIDSSGNSVTVQRSGTDTIEGSSSVNTSTQWGKIKLICGAEGSWEIL